MLIIDIFLLTLILSPRFLGKAELLDLIDEDKLLARLGGTVSMLKLSIGSYSNKTG